MTSAPPEQLTLLLQPSVSKVHSQNSKLGGYLRLAFVLLVLGLMSGNTFSYQAIEPVLIASGVFNQSCIGSTSLPCAEQLLQLNLLSDLSGSLNNVFQLPIGYCIDRFGARTMALVGGIVSCLSFAIFGLGMLGANPLFYIGYTLLSISGTGYSIAAMSVASDFGPPSGAVIPMMSAMSMVSALVFNAFRAMYYNLHVSVLVLFCGFAGILTPLAVPSAWALRNRQHQFTFPLQQMKTLVFASSVVCVSFNLLHMVFYLSTVYNQALWISGGDVQTANGMQTVFSWLFPGIGVLSTPVNAFLLVKLPVVTWAVAMAVAVAVFGAMTVIPSVGLQYVTYIIFVEWWMVLYQILFETLQRLFLRSQFATLAGMVLCLSGLMSLLSYACNWLVVHRFGNDFLGINIFFTVLSTVSSLWWAWCSRRHALLYPKNEADDEEMTSDQHQALIRDSVEPKLTPQL